MNKPEIPTVRSRQNPSGKRVYEIDYKDPFTKKRIRKTVGTRRKDADKMASQIYNDLMAKYIGEPESKIHEIPLLNLAESFLQSKKNRVAETSLKRYNTFARNFLEYMDEFFPGIKYAHEVRMTYIEELLQHLSNEGHKPKTINNQLFFIKGIYQHAIENKLLIDNPALKIKRFKDTIGSEGVPFWTKDEMDLILANVKPNWRDAIEFLYLTGLLKGELINLCWNDVNLDSESPTLAIQSKPGWTVKTNQRRVIPLNHKAAEIVKRQTKSPDHNYIFKSKYGNKIDEWKVLNAIRSALKKLGFEGNVHKLRHTNASHLVMAGVGVETVSKLLGHSSIEMTMKYAHLAPDHLRDAVNLLE